MDQQLRVLTQMIAVIIILNSCSENKNHYGYESRLMSSRIDMNCYEENLAIYNEIEAYRFKDSEYKIDGLSDFNKARQVFSIKFSTNLLFISETMKPRISICLNGSEYVGRGAELTEPNFPPECNFYFIYTENGNLNLDEDNKLFCYTSEFVPLERYKIEVLGIR